MLLEHSFTVTSRMPWLTGPEGVARRWGGEWRRRGRASRFKRRSREDRGAVECGEVVSPFYMGGSGEGIFFDFWAQKGEFWCILGLIKPTFDRAGVSIFGQQPSRGRGAIAPSPTPVDPPLVDTLAVLTAHWCNYRRLSVYYGVYVL